MLLQQCLPFTVLKPKSHCNGVLVLTVATVLTVYGIETRSYHIIRYHVVVLQQCLPFTVLKRALFKSSLRLFR